MSGKRRSPELRALQEAFKLDVVFAGDPDGPALPCYFGAYDDRPCGGPIQACHWMNRQTIRNYLWRYGVDPDLIVLAEWDPRLAVPGCAEQHHPRWDSHRVTLPSEQLHVFREEVPWEVEEAVADWGLETALEDRSPPFDPRAPGSGARSVSNSDGARFARFATGSERRLFGG